MARQVIQTDKAPIPKGPYSQGWRAGNFVYTAGLGPHDPVTGQVVGATIEEQTRQTLENIKAILEAGGAKMSDVIKVTAHLSDLKLFAGYNSVYQEYFAEPRPVRTTVGSQLSGIMVEIDAVAYVDDGR
jgi:2-iminobutanoate/2-iminopropanoate deaminase